MYINDKLKSSVCAEMMKSKFEESLWCTIEAEDGKFLIGLCYRSPSSDTSNDECRVLTEVVAEDCEYTRDTSLHDNGRF